MPTALFNIGTGQETSVLDLIELLGQTRRPRLRGRL